MCLQFVIGVFPGHIHYYLHFSDKNPTEYDQELPQSKITDIQWSIFAFSTVKRILFDFVVNEKIKICFSI